MALFIVTQTRPLATGQRKRRVDRFLVEATSDAVVIPTLMLTLGSWVVPHASLCVTPFDHQVVLLSHGETF